MTNRESMIKTGWKLDNSYARLPENFYSKIKPKFVHSPKLIILNQPLAEFLALDLQELNSKDGVDIFAGNALPDGSVPIAQAYAGHQFGYFTMLGDGRAVLLGEQITPTGGRYDVQLKGSGRTPYSRGGDGKAALGPMLREYIISEALYALGIPTTRSLAVVTTGEPVFRETVLPGAVLTRTASSHIRVGTFQYAANWGGIDNLKILADYTINRHFPSLADEQDKYLLMLREVISRQAFLISKWMLAGFIHGVMNTDNMLVSGETIDYGPCAFMDAYNPDTVFSSIDTHGRYAYGRQPSIAAWNLARFAETLLPLLSENHETAVKNANDEIAKFNSIYHSYWLDGMRKKLGIFNSEPEDERLIERLLNLMYKYHADYTNTFLLLTYNKPEETVLFGNSDFNDWYNMWRGRLMRQQETMDNSNQLMKESNPALIPRNHRVEEALEAAANYEDFSLMNRLLDALSKPFEHSPDQAEYSKLPPPTSCPYKTFCGT